MSSVDVRTAIHAGLVLTGGQGGGVVRIPSPTPLTRLNYFDGKFLRADDLALEQHYLQSLLWASNRAGGAGVSFGLDTTWGANDTIEVGSGLAIDPDGRVLLLPGPVSVSVQELIDRSRAIAPAHAHAQAVGHAEFGDCVVEESAPAGTVVHASDLYVVTIGYAEALCGEEDVYGTLCEEACVTGTDRPYRVEGVVLRARPLPPDVRAHLATSSAVTLTQAHLRSLVASAYFEDERRAVASLVSGDGIRARTWCLGADAAGGFDVPLAVIGRAGSRTTFFDAWTARRERIEPPARRYWDWRLAMRPWDVFLAQVLQFQCQLHEVLGHVPVPGGAIEDPCAPRHEMLDEAATYLGVIEHQLAPAAARRRLHEFLPGGVERLTMLRERMSAVLDQAPPQPAGNRILIHGGIVELPSAGYLPVVPTGLTSVEDQVRALLGEGVDLTFCTTRHDAVPRAFEEAQHLDRISLLTGLDDATRRQEVEIIVPDAEVEERRIGDGWQGVFRLITERPHGRVLRRPGFPQAFREGLVEEPLEVLDPAEAERRAEERIGIFERVPLEGDGAEDELRGVAAAHPSSASELRGAGRVEHQPELALRWAGTGKVAIDDDEQAEASIWLDGMLDRNPFVLASGDTLHFSGIGDAAVAGADRERLRSSGNGTLRIETIAQVPDGVNVRAVADGAVLLHVNDDDGTEVVPFPIQGVTIELRLRRSETGGTVVTGRAQIDRRAVVSARLEWYGDADSLTAAVYVADLRSMLMIASVSTAVLGEERARLTLDRDAAAASVGHPARTASEEALKRLERAFGEPGYADAARHRLFPGGDESAVRLRATRDWVLFRRRAVLRCGPVAPVVTTADTFAVYGTIARRKSIAGPGLVYLGEVAYMPGTIQLAAAETPVLERWRALAQGQELLGAGVLSGAAGGDELGKRRTRRLSESLAVHTPPAAGFDVVVVDPDDITLDLHGADGAMIFAARPRREAPPVEVGAMAVHPKIVSHYLRAMEADDFATAFNLLVEVSRPLGMAHFPEDSGEPTDAAEVSAVAHRFFEATDADAVLRTDVFTVSGDNVDGQLSVERGDAMAAAVGPAGPTQTHEVEEAVLHRLDSAGVTQRIVAVMTPSAGGRVAVVAIEPHLTERYLALKERQERIAALDLAFGNMRQLGTIGFATGADAVELPDELDEVVRRYREEGLPEQLGVDVITLMSDTTALDLRKKRGEHVRDKLGGDLNVGAIRAHPNWLAPADDNGVRETSILLLLPQP